MLGVAMGLLLAGCEDPVRPTPFAASPALQGAVMDSTGDSVAVPGVPISPDLLAGTVDVANGTVSLSVSFTPGTLSQTDTLFQVQFDTDENPSTGFPGEPGLLGIDYFVRAVVPRSSTRAALQRVFGTAPCSDAAPCPVVETADVAFPTPVEARVTFPLAALGNDDGRMTFKVIVEQWISDTAVSTVLDVMPDRGLLPGVVRQVAQQLGATPR
jgi:hypothetical protein